MILKNIFPILFSLKSAHNYPFTCSNNTQSKATKKSRKYSNFSRNEQLVIGIETLTIKFTTQKHILILDNQQTKNKFEHGYRQAKEKELKIKGQSLRKIVENSSYNPFK